MADGHILIGITQLLLLAATEVGLSRHVLLAEAGIDERELVDGEGHISIEQHRRIGMQVLARVPGHELPAIIARVITPASFGVIGKLARNSATLRDALSVFMRYQQLLISGARIVVDTSVPGECAFVVEMPELIDSLRFPILAMVAAWLSLSRQLTGQDVRPRRVELAMPPMAEHSDELAAPLGCVPRFDSPRHALVFDEDIAALEIAGARPQRAAVLRAYADALLADLGVNPGVASRVCEQLVASMTCGDVRQDTVARQLGMSARTLSRRLKAEHTTFGDLLERVRREMAQRYLRDQRLSVHEVAFLLGYSEPSTFFRSFRRWTGTTPRGWRSTA
jgi:AraC-like DNA-binding protein